MENWLNAMLQTFRDFPKVGLVGSKLIYSDGTLQEAGGVLWADGSGWNYGRNQNANLHALTMQEKSIIVQEHQ